MMVKNNNTVESNPIDTDIAHITKSINEYSILYKKVSLMECE